jgi:hypothetical protein
MKFIAPSPGTLAAMTAYSLYTMSLYCMSHNVYALMVIVAPWVGYFVLGPLTYPLFDWLVKRASR